MIRQSAYLLSFCVVALLGLGFMMLSSVAEHVTMSEEAGVYDIVEKQAIWLALGFIGCVVCASLDYRLYERFAWVLYVIGIGLLVLCFVPGIGVKANGAWRWIKFGGLSMQPSEFARLAIIVILATWLAKNLESVRTMWRGWVLPLLIIGLPVGLIAVEKDLGCTALVVCSCLMVMFVAGTRWFYLALMAVGGMGALALAIFTIEDRLARWFAFLNLEETKLDAGFQQWQSLIAFKEGALFGVGLGLGRQKGQGMPFPHTDFIFPMIGEELGLVTTMLVLVAFMVIGFSGVMIASYAPTPFGRFLGIGLTCLIVFQAIINMGVATATLPNKGMPLPFISAGGSNLMGCLLAVGILLNIYRQGVDRTEDGQLMINRARVTPKL